MFWKMLNIKADKRTIINICLLPLIILRIPMVLFFWVVEWINGWSEYVESIWPAWNPGNWKG